MCFGKFTKPLAVAAFATALSLCAGIAQAGDELYKAFGRNEGISKIIDDFVGIVVADSRVNFQFAKLDAAGVGRLKGHLVEMLCAATGGPYQYTGRDMKTTHAGMGVNDAQFNAIAEDMYGAWDKNGVPYHLQNKVMAILATMHKDIATKK